jgi:Arc/MetJ-type ribon-helix-helix transcriptional regulator
VWRAVPPEQLKQVEARAKKDNRTLSEFIREALRRYLYERDREDLRIKTQARAARLGITEADIVPLIHQLRTERRGGKTR